MKTNKIIGIVIAIMLIGTVSAYSWTASIDNILHDLYCQDCILDNPTIINYSFSNGSGNGTWNHSELTQLAWSAAGHVMDSNINFTVSPLYIYSLNNNAHIKFHENYIGIYSQTTDRKAQVDVSNYDTDTTTLISLKVNSDVTSNESKIKLTPNNILIQSPLISVDKYLCTDSDSYLISCNGSSYNDTNITNYINQLQNNDTNHNSRLNSLESNDTVNYVPYPRYNFTNKNRVFNTTYTNNNNYPLYINAKVYVFGATASYICKINFYINNTLIDISYSNVDYINRDPSDFRTFTYILSPSSNYRIDRTGNGACTEVLELVYEHPFY